MTRRAASVFAIVVLTTSCSSGPDATKPSPTPSTPARILVFTKTAGFRHSSIPVAREALSAAGTTNGYEVDATENAQDFTDANLARYRAVVFLMTTGDVLDDAQQNALRRFVEAGRGFAGVHSATDTEYKWPWYHELIGATFKSHPKIQPAMVRVDDTVHPSTTRLPRGGWRRTDEWYNFTGVNPDRIHTLLSVLESTYTGGTMGATHPIAWCRMSGSARVWYTAAGHTEASYSEPEFFDHLESGVRWVAGLIPGNC